MTDFVTDLMPASKVWYLDPGTPVSDVLASVAKMQEFRLNRAASGKPMRVMEDDDDDDWGLDPIIEVANGLAVIKVEGPLVKSGGWWERMFGITSYSEIRKALYHALGNDQVSKIAMVYDTPGGEAAGADALANLIKMADMRKPVYAYADGQMCSGGYYLGAPARKIFAQRTSFVGSVGVISMHVEMTERLKDAGVKVEVFRSGKFKALGTPYEKLSPEASESIQSRMDGFYDIFNAHVVSCRGATYTSVPDFLNRAGEGRVFMGEQARQTGLIDRVLEWGEALEIIENDGKSTSLFGGLAAKSMSGKTMTAELPAQAAEGQGEGSEEKVAPAAEGSGEGSAENSAAQESNGQGEQTQTPAAASDTSAISTLAEKLAETKVELHLAKAEVTSLRLKEASLEQQISALSTHLNGFIHQRSVMLGYRATDVSNMGTSERIALADRLESEVKERFKTGQQSISHTAQAVSQSAELTEQEQAVMDATSSSKR